jgi:hypothetical protein
MQDYLGAEPTFGLDDSEDFFGYHVPPTMIKNEVMSTLPFKPSKWRPGLPINFPDLPGRQDCVDWPPCHMCLLLRICTVLEKLQYRVPWAGDNRQQREYVYRRTPLSSFSL